MFESVFSVQDLIAFFDDYFMQIAWETHYLEIKSKNTEHYWLIIHTERENKPFMLLHKHKKAYPYHKQCDCLTVNSAIRKIKKHDAYWLSNS